MSGMMAMERVRVPKTAEVVAQAIRLQIVRGDISEGDPLPSEANLMEQFGVSRPSLREAFRILESEKLIVVRRGSRGGARATKPDVTVAARYLGLLMQFDGVLLSDVFEARALIEPLALRLLAQDKNRASSAKKLLATIDQITPELRDPRVRADIWMSFFVQLFELAGNRTLSLLYGTLTEVIREELEDSMQDLSSNPDDDSASKAVRKVMALVVDGKDDEAANFWMGQMFMLQEKVARLHRRKTLVDAASNRP